MKFSSFIPLALASVAAASPVATQDKRLDLSPITDAVGTTVEGTVAGVAGVANSTTGTVDTIVKDVEALLSTLIGDVEGVASAAGIDVSELLGSVGLTSTAKRDVVPVSIEQRDVNAIISAVSKLLTDLLGSIVTLAGDAGLSLVGTLLSILNI